MSSATFYYKNIPACLNDLVLADKRSTLTKEGLYEFEGIRCSRAVINLESIDYVADQERLNKLIDLLEILDSNQEIIAYSVKY